MVVAAQVVQFICLPSDTHTKKTFVPLFRCDFTIVVEPAHQQKCCSKDTHMLPKGNNYGHFIRYHCHALFMRKSLFI